MDLFAWNPPPETALILAFPQARNIGRARHVADSVRKRRTQKSRQSYFDRALHGLGVSLQASGLVAAQIDTELEAFTRLVNAELRRSEWDGRLQPGGTG